MDVTMKESAVGQSLLRSNANNDRPPKQEKKANLFIEIRPLVDDAVPPAK